MMSEFAQATPHEPATLLVLVQTPAFRNQGVGDLAGEDGGKGAVKYLRPVCFYSSKVQQQAHISPVCSFNVKETGSAHLTVTQRMNSDPLHSLGQSSAHDTCGGSLCAEHNPHTPTHWQW